MMWYREKQEFYNDILNENRSNATAVDIKDLVDLRYNYHMNKVLHKTNKILAERHRISNSRPHNLYRNCPRITMYHE